MQKHSPLKIEIPPQVWWFLATLLSTWTMLLFFQPIQLMRLILETNRILIHCDEDDVKRFYEHGEVEEAVTFGESFGDKLVYALRYSHSYERMHVTLIANELRVFIPKPTALEFCTGTRDAFGEVIDIGEGRELFVRVEKDQEATHNAASAAQETKHAE